MNAFQAIGVGVIYGFTEIFPISSSGHLIMFQKLFQLPAESDVLYFFIHVAFFSATVLYFARDILRFFTEKSERYLLKYIIVAMAPTALIGYFFPGFLTRFFQRFRMVGLAMAVNGILLFIASLVCKDVDRCVKKKGSGVLQALFVGVAQGLSVIPGTSRNSMAIIGSIFAGFDRETVFRFSFLCSIPVIAGQILVKGMQLRWAVWEEDTHAYLIAAATAGIATFLSLGLMRRVLLSNKLYPFAIYCAIVGFAMAVFLFKLG